MNGGTYPASLSDRSSLVLLTVARKWLGRLILITNLALNLGSSNDGNTSRACVGCICVVASHLYLRSSKYFSHTI